jgi:hypothetical protein
MADSNKLGRDKKMMRFFVAQLADWELLLCRPGDGWTGCIRGAVRTVTADLLVAINHLVIISNTERIIAQDKDSCFCKKRQKF